MATILNSHEDEELQQMLMKKHRVRSAESEKERGIEGEQLKMYEDPFISDRDDQFEDPFIPTFSHLPRAIHKKCVNTLLNARNHDSAKKALMNTYYWYDAVEDEVVVKVYDSKGKRQGIKAFPGNKVEATKYLEDFCFSHPQLAPYVCKGVGNALQWMDSEIMLWVVRLGVETGIPVLPVHDEVVFPACHVEEMQYLLKRAVQTVLKDYGKFGTMMLKQTWLEDGKNEVDQFCETGSWER